MSSHDIIMGAAGASGGATNYIEDVFSTWLFTGNSTTNNIVNGIDLSTYGGMLWTKSRSSALTGAIYDSAIGLNKYLIPSSTAAAGANTGVTFNTNGFTVGANDNANSTTSAASWTFRKQPKFFDVVTYTGNGVAGLNVSHNLGSVPGCIIVKRTDSTGDWFVYHRSLTSNAYYLRLNLTDAQSNISNAWNSTSPTSTQFTVGDHAGVNANGFNYVAYLFADNAGGFGLTGTDNVISCGSFTTDGSGAATVNLGYEPQWSIIKPSSAAGSWIVRDNMRGWVADTSGNSSTLIANLSNAENTAGTGYSPTATGMKVTGAGASTTFIYIAIRRGPMKVPTDATKVFSPVTYTGSGAAKTVTAGFPVDLSLNGNRGTATIGQFFFDRLRGATKSLNSTDTSAEATDSTSLTSFASNTDITLGTSASGWVNDSGRTYIDWMFRRAPSFFDEVCYTGTGANQTPSHNLGVAPQLIILKDRSTANAWYVEHSFTSTTWALSYLNYDYAASAGRSYDTVCPAQPTSSVFSLGTNSATNTSGRNYVAYLFASCPGVSKVGSYTGNGSSQTINCGFAAGARFVLIKRTDSTGDWYVWDTARGIVAGNDPHLSLNTNVAEVTTDDTIDPDSSGFIVNQLAATNVNVNAATYIYLAIA